MQEDIMRQVHDTVIAGMRILLQMSPLLLPD